MLNIEQPALGPFLHELGQLLEPLPAAELRRMLLDHAAQLPARERTGFLAIFRRGPGADREAGQDLVDDVESFVADVGAGKYIDGWGYDADYRDHRAFGDDLWTIEMADLFRRADAAFLAGDAASARDAYRGLLEALADDFGGEGGFPGAGTPEELLDVDTAEAKQRCLRCAWEAEPVTTRAAALIEVARALTYIGGPPRLAALDATRRDPLPDLDAVLPDLIVELREIDPTGFPFGADARHLLAEVTERHRGADGLAELARSPGPERAAAYRDWVDGLIRARRLTDAEDAAVEALEQLEPHGPGRAALADQLAILALLRAHGDGVCDARVLAWRADPTLPRLLRLIDIASAQGRLPAVLDTEAGRVGDGPVTDRAALAAAVLLLAGRVDAAQAMLTPTSGPDGWMRGFHPGPVVVPALLIGASGAANHPRWRDLLLAELVDDANSVGRPYAARADDLGDLSDVLAVPADIAAQFRGVPADELLLSELLVAAMTEHPAGLGQRAGWMRQARGHVDARVALVVGGKRRSEYQRTAHLVAACAEAVTISQDAPAAQRYLAGVHAGYPRHTSFRKELRAAVTASPLLR